MDPILQAILALDTSAEVVMDVLFDQILDEKEEPMQVYVIQIIERRGPIVMLDELAEGMYVKEYDPEMHSGRGSVVGTHNVNDARHFTTVTDAHDFYRKQSKTKPYRDDGRPNRPLTAFTVSIFPVEIDA